MSHKTYTPSQMSELLSFPGVLSCSAKYLRFTPEFKKKVLDLSETEFLSSRAIFRHFGLPTYIVETPLPKSALKDWKRQYRLAGMAGLTGTKKGRKKKETAPLGTSPPDELEYLRAKIAYLEAENTAFRLIRAGKYKL